MGTYLTQIEAVPIPQYSKPGRPVKGQNPQSYVYRIQGRPTINQELITLAHTRAGRFVIATNVLESESVTAEKMLCEYKGQQATERGFRFLKDPLFFTSRVFLKNSKRVAALALVMGLCLLVYTLAQRTLRQALCRTQQTIQNQLGKPTATPIMRWVFQCFQSIHLVVFNEVPQVVNLTAEHQVILRLLGASCQKYYLLL